MTMNVEMMEMTTTENVEVESAVKRPRETVVVPPVGVVRVTVPVIRIAVRITCVKRLGPIIVCRRHGVGVSRSWVCQRGGHAWIWLRGRPGLRPQFPASLQQGRQDVIGGTALLKSDYLLSTWIVGYRRVLYVCSDDIRFDFRVHHFDNVGQASGVLHGGWALFRCV